MKLPVVLHELAERELNEAAAYYAAARPGLGDAFIVAVERATSLVSEMPTAGRVVLMDIRWWLVRRFPYAVVYRLRDDHLRVLAIANTKRRPLYWRIRQ